MSRTPACLANFPIYSDSPINLRGLMSVLALRYNLVVTYENEHDSVRGKVLIFVLLCRSFNFRTSNTGAVTSSGKNMLL